MYMRRKNLEHGRIKRLPKRNKACDFFSHSIVYYIKLMLIWGIVLTFDFLMEFRFEYIWPCWLLMRSVHDSVKYQGFVFSIFFMLIALTCDVICYLLIPVTWLFFLGSTYVWVHLVWHAERGVCFPTVALCFLFIYVEFAVRLRTSKNLSLGMDLCRPFAANCIGYPVVTMGFGLKSYASYKFRMRKQREVASENLFYFELLDQALPEECRRFSRFGADTDIDAADDEVDAPTSPSTNRTVDNGKKRQSPSVPIQQDESDYLERPLGLPSVEEDTCSNDHAGTSTSPITRKANPVTSTTPTSGVNAPASALANSCPALTSVPPVSSHDNSSTTTAALPSSSTSTPGQTVPNGSLSPPTTAASSPASAGGNNGGKAGKSAAAANKTKDDYTARLESDLRRLKTELQSCRSCEAELRAQLALVGQGERSARADLTHCRQEMDALGHRIANLTHRANTEKTNTQTAEKRLTDERRQRMAAEQQVLAEKKLRKEESESHARAVQAAAAAAAKSVAAAAAECSDACRARRRELETEIKSLSRDLRLRQDRVQVLEIELADLIPLRGLLEERANLLNSVMALREDNDRLGQTLRDENKMKQDLITAYHSSQKEITELNAILTRKEYQILELTMRLDMLTSPLICPTGYNGLYLGNEMGGSGTGHNLSNPPGMGIPLMDPNEYLYPPDRGQEFVQQLTVQPPPGSGRPSSLSPDVNDGQGQGCLH